MVPTAAGAYNVRLEDVENENLQSGMQSQIKSTTQGLHIACRVGPQNSTQCRQHLCLLLLFVISKPCLISMCDNTTHCECCAGVLAATEHRWDDAEKQFRIVLEQEPDSASAWSNLGNVHLSKGRPQEAYRDFTEAIRLAPTVSQLMHYRRISRNGT